VECINITSDEYYGPKDNDEIVSLRKYKGQPRGNNKLLARYTRNFSKSFKRLVSKESSVRSNH